MIKAKEERKINQIVLNNADVVWLRKEEIQHSFWC
jgi:hypothetical protein